MESGLGEILSNLMSYPAIGSSIALLVFSVLLLILKRKSASKKVKIFLVIIAVVAAAVLLFLAIMAVLFGNYHPVATPTQPNGPFGPLKLEVYLVADDMQNMENMDIDSLTLADAPVFTSDDIHKYYWGEQAFVMDKDLLRQRINGDEITPLPVPVSGLPYVAVVTNERINERVYVGQFWTVLSSSTPTYPFIVVDGTLGKDNGQFDVQENQQLYAVHWFDDMERPDSFDNRIYNALNDAGVLAEIE